MNSSRRVCTPSHTKETTSTLYDTALMTPPPTPAKREVERKAKPMSHAERKKERYAAKKAIKRLQRKERKASQTQQTPSSESQSVPTRLPDMMDMHQEERAMEGHHERKRCKHKNSDHGNDHGTKSGGRTVSKLRPRFHGKGRSFSLTEKDSDTSAQAAHTSDPHYESTKLTMDVNRTPAKRIVASIDAHTPDQSPNSNSLRCGEPSTRHQLDYDSEEEHEKELDRLLTISLAKGGNNYNYGTDAACPFSRAHQSDGSTCVQEDSTPLSPEHDIDPDVTSAFNDSFAFICETQHEQYELDAKVHKIEAEIKAIRNKVFKLDPRDYWKIKQFERLIDLSLALNHELFISEYAFRDVLDMRAADEDLDLSGELAKLQEEALKMFRKYDAEVLKLREWYMCDAWAERD